jgi:long-chain fatty acid transport protein
VGWDDWSALDNLLISTEQGSSEIARNWKDTYHFISRGAFITVPTTTGSCRPASPSIPRRWTRTPVDEDDRTPDMPIDRRIRYAVGAQYQWADDINVGASFVFIDMGDAEIDRSFLKGEYSENYLVFFGLNLGWKF